MHMYEVVFLATTALVFASRADSREVAFKHDCG
jgi:hypothetical protein